MKFGGAGGLADIEDVIVWLADSCSSESTRHSASHSSPPASPRITDPNENGGDEHRDNENGVKEHRDQASAETGRAAWTRQANAATAVERDLNPNNRPGQRLSMKDQDELMAKIEADPDNMDLLMQLQEVHRSLSMVSSCFL